MMKTKRHLYLPITDYFDSVNIKYNIEPVIIDKNHQMINIFPLNTTFKKIKIHITNDENYFFTLDTGVVIVKVEDVVYVIKTILNKK